jgi:hypothetical protein
MSLPYALPHLGPRAQTKDVATKENDAAGLFWPAASQKSVKKSRS